MPTAWLQQFISGIPTSSNTSDVIDFCKTFLTASSSVPKESDSVKSDENVDSAASKNEMDANKTDDNEVTEVGSDSDTEVDEGDARNEAAKDTLGEAEVDVSNKADAVGDVIKHSQHPSEFFQGPIDISGIVCPHGASKVHPLNARNFKCIADTAYCQLISVAEVVPGVDLSPAGAICSQCCDDFLRDVSSLSEALKRDEAVIDLCSRIANNSAYHFAPASDNDPLYRVSREWFSAFKKAAEVKRRRCDLWLQLLNTSATPSVEGGKLPDWSTKSEVLLLSNINSSLLCEHGNIREDFRRVSVPMLSEDWLRLQSEYYPAATSVADDAVVCEVCQSAAVQTKETKRAMIDERSKEKNDRPLLDLRNRKQAHPPSIVSLVSAFSSQDQSSAVKRQLKSITSSTK